MTSDFLNMEKIMSPSPLPSFIVELKKCPDSESLYQAIITLGKTSPYRKIWDFKEDEKVHGCQSLMYVRITKDSNRFYFDFYSDALISQGLAALLIHFYHGKTAKEILTTPPLFLKELNLTHLLSMGRSNGLEALYKKMIQLTLTSCKDT